MTHPHDRALEAAARALYDSDEGPFRLPWARLSDLSRGIRRKAARAAVAAYLDALAAQEKK
jgi:hypothetical protein